MKTRVAAAVGILLFALLAFWLRFEPSIPFALRDAFGGFAYVVIWIVTCFILMPQVRAVRVAWSVLLITCLLEILQLWHPFWLEQIRKIPAGRLLLGTTFEWSDFPPCVIGAIAGWALIKALQGLSRQKTHERTDGY